MDLNNINAVVFDLDGTLYQEPNFYKGYLSLLLDGTPWEPELEAVTDFAAAVLAGKTALKMGGFLRRNTPPVKTAEKLYGICSEANAGDNFEKRFFCGGYYYMGDAWSVVAAIALLLDIAQENLRESFIEIRRLMVSGNTLITSGQVFDEIKALTNRGALCYLFTNTHDAAAIPFVEHMGLAGLIPNIEFGTDKPYGLERRMPAIAEKSGGADKVLSVGDHGFNDLSPVKSYGGKTALISPYRIHDGINWDFRISALEQLAELLAGVHI